MLCEACQKREAMVHIKATLFRQAAAEMVGADREQHFCEECADEYWARTPGMNSMRGLICLSDSYRSKLYDLLKAKHPETFDNSDTEASRRGSKLMKEFLREHLRADKIEVNDDAFDMLFQDFLGRVNEFKRTKG